MPELVVDPQASGAVRAAGEEAASQAVPSDEEAAG